MLRRLFIVLVLLLKTLAPVAAQDATPETCPESQPPRLPTEGGFARVLPGSANRVRSEPTTSGTPLGQIPGGGIFWVSDGPVCADGFTWWYAEYRGLNGWTAEGTDSEYWLEPVSDEDSPILNIDGLSSVILFLSTELGQDSKVYVTDLTGEVSVNLTPPDFSDTVMSVSPDGTQIAFLTHDNNERRYFLGTMGFDGSFRRTFDGAIPDTFSWSPDNERLVISVLGSVAVADTTALRANLFVMSAEGGEPRRLTSGDFDHSEASWSPDSTQIAYVVRNTNGNNDSLWVMNLDTGEEHQILELEANLGAVQWSPDGSGIVFRASFHSDPTFYQNLIVNPDGSNMRQPTGDGLSSSSFAWSPDGSRIAFVTYGENGGDQIFVVNADGSGRTQLTSEGSCNTDPAWSPDGQSLVFVSNRDREQQNMCVGDIYVMNADGSNVRRLSDNERNNHSARWINIAPPLPAD